jgi:two-component system LytT family response regulator
MQAILIDDVQESLETLSYLLGRHCPNVQIVATCRSAAEGIEKIRKHNPDLVFLDIEMDGMSGLEMLISLQPVNFEVVFVTGHNEYAQQAIRLSALDYLSKPPIAEELMGAVLRAAQNRANKAMFERYELFFNTLLRQKSDLKPNRIALPANNKVEYIDLHHILYLHAERSYCTFHLHGGREILVAKSMGEYEDALVSANFQRAHRSYVVNIDHVRYYHKADEQVELVNGARIPVSKTEKEQFLKKLNGR